MNLFKRRSPGMAMMGVVVLMVVLGMITYGVSHMTQIGFHSMESSEDTSKNSDTFNDIVSLLTKEQNCTRSLQGKNAKKTPIGQIKSLYLVDGADTHAIFPVKKLNIKGYYISDHEDNKPGTTRLYVQFEENMGKNIRDRSKSIKLDVSTNTHHNITNCAALVGNFRNISPREVSYKGTIKADNFTVKSIQLQPTTLSNDCNSSNEGQMIASAEGYRICRDGHWKLMKTLAIPTPTPQPTFTPSAMFDQCYQVAIFSNKIFVSKNKYRESDSDTKIVKKFTKSACNQSQEYICIARKGNGMAGQVFYGKNHRGGVVEGRNNSDGCKTNDLSHAGCYILFCNLREYNEAF